MSKITLKEIKEEIKKSNNPRYKLTEWDLKESVKGIIKNNILNKKKEKTVIIQTYSINSNNEELFGKDESIENYKRRKEEERKKFKLNINMFEKKIREQIAKEKLKP